MSKGTADYYLGIDLGTTNSIMSWGAINPHREELDTQIINIPMKNRKRAGLEIRSCYLLLSILTNEPHLP